MKIVVYLVLTLLLLAGCQKEKLPPAIDFSYTITDTGFLSGTLISEEVNYEIDFGDGSSKQTGQAFKNSPLKISHRYTQKGTFKVTIIVNNKNGTSNYEKQIDVSSVVLKPTAEFSYTIGNNGDISIRFNASTGDKYELDFGDGRIVKDSLGTSTTYLQHNTYAKNGSYTVILTVINPEGLATSEQVVNINNIKSPIADFSYKISENGRISLTNLSKNSTDYKWLIKHYSAYYTPSNANYTSTEQDVNVAVDLSGYYYVRLEAYTNGIKKTKEKIIKVSNAPKQMEFSGNYKGAKISGSLENNGLAYIFTYASMPGTDGGNVGLHQGFIPATYKNDTLEVSESFFIKVYPLIFYNTNVVSEIENAEKAEARFLVLKKYLTQSTDKDIIEVTEEVLDTNFYNSNAFYPKAFWVKYKIKNESLDGELKVRILVAGK